MAHQHSVYDTDPHFKIDGFTMAITDQSERPTRLMKGDHNSERFTFEIDRRIDGHDMTLCNQIQVHFLNIDTSTKDTHADVYLVKDMGLSPASDKVAIFSWLVSKASTKYAGMLNFRIRFACIGENGEELYAKHTDIFKGMPIGDGYNHSAQAVEEYSDVLAKWEHDLFEQGSTSVANVNVARDAAITAVQEEGAAQIAAVEAKGAETLESIPDDFSAVAAEAEANTAAIEEVDKHRAALESRSNRQGKLIKNLSQAIQNATDGITPDPYDNTPAFTRDVPSNALPYAEVSEIGGVTRKCTNLIKAPYQLTSQTIAGLTITVDNEKQSITLNGTYSGDSKTFVLGSFAKAEVSAGTYYCYLGAKLPQGCSMYSFVGDVQQVWIEYNLENCFKTITTGGEAGVVRLWIGNGAVFNNITIRPMLAESETALPCEPYFEGLRSAPVSEVVSEGVQLFDVAKAQIGYRCNNDGSLVKNGSYATSDYIEVKGSTAYYLTNVCGNAYVSAVLFDVDKAFLKTMTVGDGAANGGTQTSGILYTPSDSKYIRINIFTDNVDINTVMVHKGTTTLPYTPYIKRTLTLPEAVQALPDYGVGIPNTDYFNRIRWRYDEPTDKWVREYYRPMKTVDLGTLYWVAWENSTFYTDSVNKKNGVLNLYTSKYETASGLKNGHINGNEVNRNIYITDTFTTVAELKAALSGVMLVYEAATPEITDISDILPEDNLIGVQAGGTITPVNEYGYAVPMTIK